MIPINVNKHAITDAPAIASVTNLSPSLFLMQNQVRHRLTAKVRHSNPNRELKAVMIRHYFVLTLVSILSSEMVKHVGMVCYHNNDNNMKKQILRLHI